MILAFIGGLGSGKTLSMVRFMYESNSPIFANFKLFCKDRSITLLNKEFFDKYSKGVFNLYNACVGIDEIAVWFDSRAAMSTKARALSRFITQSRKRKVNFTYTVQDSDVKSFLESGFVDLRARKLADFFIFCRYFDLGENKYCLNVWMDKNGNVVKRDIFHANPYFSLYDSDEIIDIE